MDPDVTKETSFESPLYGVSVPRSLDHEDGIYEGPSSISRPGVASNDDVLAKREVTNGTSLHISGR